MARFDEPLVFGIGIIILLMIVFALAMMVVRYEKHEREDDRFLIIYRQNDLVIYQDSVTGLCYVPELGPVVCGESDAGIYVVEPAKAESR